MERIPGTSIGDMISGSQVAMHGVRMFRQMVKLCLTGVVLLSLVFVGWNLWREHDRHPQQIKAAVMYLQVTSLGLLYRDDSVFHFTRADGSAGSITGAQIRKTPAFRQSWLALRGRMWRDLMTGMLWSGGLTTLFLGWFAWTGRRLRKPRSLRGARMATSKRLDRLTTSTYGRRRDRHLPRYRLAGVTWPHQGETRHTMITGSTGTGKTVAISALLAQIRAEGGKAIIYDKMRSFVPYFYDGSRDFILNPLDARSHDWDMFGEVRHERDWDTIAMALIPQFKDTADPFWTTAARQIFAVGCAALWKQRKGSVPVIVDKLLQTEIEELAEEMQDTVIQGLVDPANDKMTTSIRAILTTSLRPLIYMPEARRPLSIRNWLEREEQDSFLFLSSGGWDHESRMALIATQMEVAIVSMISGERDPDRRIWFIIDELPTMAQIPSLKSALAESRQFGGCFVIGTQVISELREIYGRNDAETISGNCNTRLVLGTPDMATAQFCADSLGRSQTVQMNRSLSFGASEVRDGVAISQRDQIGNVVLPSEVMELPKLHGYLRMGGGFPVTRIELETQDYPVIAAHHVPAEVPDPMTGEIYDTGRPTEPAPSTPDDRPEESPASPPNGIDNAMKPAGRAAPRLTNGPSGPATARQAATPAIGDDEYGEDADPAPWKGSSPSGPPGYLTDIPPEVPERTSKPAKTSGSGKKSRKKKPATDPMGQPNGGLTADTPEHQAALDFQAPADMNEDAEPATSVASSGNEADHIADPAHDADPVHDKAGLIVHASANDDEAVVPAALSDQPIGEAGETDAGTKAGNTKAEKW